ncbi:unnamed protein product [Cylicocyclus nassatus]|uniref:Uncharacterized protein n=1 Tax=Cylicocyclus nassatus TaxID=53992 RepID=A0AA36HG21_CYLNA|nr:unnamed protein product [Cylicocyclus nassatus]
MNTMQGYLSQESPEWNIDMATPLQALLSQNFHQKKLVSRIDGICKLSASYQLCLAQCPQNPAKRILLSGQKAWNIICYDFRNDSDFRKFVVPCWSKQGLTLTEQCSSLARTLHLEMIQLMEGGLDNLRQGMDTLCRSVHSYDSCFIMKSHESCGVKAAKFLVKLTHQTSHALVDLLDEVLGVRDLPRSCLDWLVHNYASKSGPRGIAKRMKTSRRTSLVMVLLVVICYNIIFCVNQLL